jgi:hypothetical protein
MRLHDVLNALLLTGAGWSLAPEASAEPLVVGRPAAFTTLVNPACSHCQDEAKRRLHDLKPQDRVLCWTRGYSDGGAIPIRFFLAPYRVISDSYGVFVYDPDAGYARGFAPSYLFRFHGWRNGVMVMKHKDGTLYSCLSGRAFAGPTHGERLQAVPTVVSDWGAWLEQYPPAVAYHMYDKYQPMELPTKDEPDSVKTRAKPDPRLQAEAQVLGVWTGKTARAYPLDLLAKSGVLNEEIDGQPLVIFWEPKTRTGAAYRPVASQPRKYKGPAPDADGVSPPNEGVLTPPGTAVVSPRKLTLRLGPEGNASRFRDEETHSTWDVAGRCIAGSLKGWTLAWVDAVQVKWFAWAAEYPQTTLYGALPPNRPSSSQNANASNKVKEIAGTAEFLRLLPKPFATVKGIDPNAGTVTLLIEGEKEAKVWPVEPDAEVKVAGWWGRLEQFKAGDRVWVWLKLDRKKKATSVLMLADEASEFDMHGSLRKKADVKPQLTREQLEAKRHEQKAWLRQRWIDDGLPGTLTMHHVFSGELELALDHEALRWGRSLHAGDTVHLQVEPPIKAVVKAVTPWRERTVLRLVVGELESSELKTGQRLKLKRTPPTMAEEDSLYPPDIGRARTQAERVEWFLASIYCTCGVGKDTCTGHFYTLASCNPNGCAMPRHMRDNLNTMMDRGMTDQQILDVLLKESGPLLLRPHLRP